VKLCCDILEDRSKASAVKGGVSALSLLLEKHGVGAQQSQQEREAEAMLRSSSWTLESPCVLIF